MVSCKLGELLVGLKLELGIEMFPAVCAVNIHYHSISIDSDLRLMSNQWIQTITVQSVKQKNNNAQF